MKATKHSPISLKDRLQRSSWKRIYVFIQGHRQCQEAEAEDLTQEVFGHLLREDRIDTLQREAETEEHFLRLPQVKAKRYLIDHHRLKIPNPAEACAHQELEKVLSRNQPTFFIPSQGCITCAIGTACLSLLMPIVFSAPFEIVRSSFSTAFSMASGGRYTVSGVVSAVRPVRTEGGRFAVTSDAGSNPFMVVQMLGVPTLEFAHLESDQSRVVLFWTINPNMNVGLQESTSLDAVAWTASALSVQTVGNEQQVTFDTDTIITRLFFRLQHQP